MLPLDVAAMLEEFNVGPLTVERRTAPAGNVFGGFDAQEPPALVVINPIAAHTVARGREMDGRAVVQEPEADRYTEETRFYAGQRLFAGDGGFARDVVLYRGRRWRITSVEDNELQGEVYIANAVLEEVQETP